MYHGDDVMNLFHAEKYLKDKKVAAEVNELFKRYDIFDYVFELLVLKRPETIIKCIGEKEKQLLVSQTCYAAYLFEKAIMDRIKTEYTEKEAKDVFLKMTVDKNNELRRKLKGKGA